MNIKVTATFAALLLAAAAPLGVASGSKPDGDAIAKKMASQSVGYGSLQGDVVMTLRNQGGETAERRFSLKMLERNVPDEGDYSLVTFRSPADVKGTALLTHPKINGDDDQWLYLPALRRVKRISSSNRTGSFVGSEFSYEDLTGNVGEEYSWQLVAEGPCRDNKTCYKLDARPKDAKSGYSKRVLYVEKDTHRIQKVVFYDRKGQKLKALKYDQYKKIGKYWRAQRWHMKNYQTHKDTILVFESLKLGSKLDESDFNKARLKSS